MGLWANMQNDQNKVLQITTITRFQISTLMDTEYFPVGCRRRIYSKPFSEQSRSSPLAAVSRRQISPRQEKQRAEEDLLRDFCLPFYQPCPRKSFSSLCSLCSVRPSSSKRNEPSNDTEDSVSSELSATAYQSH